MSHRFIGTVTIDHQVTSIRKYDNGFYTVEFNEDVKYSAKTLEQLEMILNEDQITYKIIDRC